MEKFNVNIQAANWNVIIPNVEAANEDDALINAVEIIKEDSNLARTLPKHPERWAKIAKVLPVGRR
jgi:hypothetical protein